MSPICRILSSQLMLHRALIYLLRKRYVVLSQGADFIYYNSKMTFDFTVHELPITCKACYNL